MNIPSPFDNHINCSIVSRIFVSDIVSSYEKEYATNTAYIFGDLNEIYLCKCPLTELEFFYPRNLHGDEVFYESLSKGDWYYQTERWEYAKAIEYIKDNDLVLEIGSGSGSFINLLTRSKKIAYCGLELNKNGISNAKRNGVNLTNELLSAHVTKNQKKYNVVCSFQVFEHVSDINQLFKDSVRSLTDNGLLIISVPNNSTDFIRNNILPSRYLNMPPHHVNLFTEHSLRKIAPLFGLKVERILIENIQPMYVDVYLYNMINRIFLNINLFTRIFWKLNLHKLFRGVVRSRASKIKGHTVLAILRKLV